MAQWPSHQIPCSKELWCSALRVLLFVMVALSGVGWDWTGCARASDLMYDLMYGPWACLLCGRWLGSTGTGNPQGASKMEWGARHR